MIIPPGYWFTYEMENKSKTYKAFPSFHYRSTRNLLVNTTVYTFQGNYPNLFTLLKKLREWEAFSAYCTPTAEKKNCNSEKPYDHTTSRHITVLQ